MVMSCSGMGSRGFSGCYCVEWSIGWNAWKEKSGVGQIPLRRWGQALPAVFSTRRVRLPQNGFFLYPGEPEALFGELEKPRLVRAIPSRRVADRGVSEVLHRFFPRARSMGASSGEESATRQIIQSELGV